MACAVLALGAVVAVSPVACNSNGVPQAIIASNVEPSTTPPNASLGCNAQGKFLWVPEQGSTNPEGPDTTNSTLITATGTGDITLNCSVVPSGNGFNVLATAESSNPTTGGSITIQGMFTPRIRAPGDAGTPTSDGTQIPGIQVDFQNGTVHLQDKSCFAVYEQALAGSPAASLPNQADTYADSNGGRIWVSVFCDSATNLLEQQKPGNPGCAMSATFRFENCTSHQ